MSAPIIIYGPPGCGKTPQAKQIAEYFGKAEIVEEWSPTTPLKSNAIAFTNHYSARTALKFDQAVSALEMLNASFIIQREPYERRASFFKFLEKN
jgi:broad-specificity NMP kinase